MHTPEIYRHQLSHSAIHRIPAEERDFLFGACHLANELSMLHKLANWSIRYGKDANKMIQHGQIAQSLFLLRTLSGKLKEGHVLLSKHYWGAKLSLTYNDLLDRDAREALQRIKRYFQKGENRIASVRNNYAFHYSPDASGAALDSLAEEERLTFYAAPLALNCLYYFSEQLAATAMLGEVSHKALEDFLNDVTGLSKSFFTFIHGYLGAFLERFPEVLEPGLAEKVVFEELLRFEEVSLPFFTTEPV